MLTFVLTLLQILSLELKLINFSNTIMERGIFVVREISLLFLDYFPEILPSLYTYFDRMKPNDVATFRVFAIILISLRKSRDFDARISCVFMLLYDQVILK